MSLNVRDNETIQVGITPGLVAGVSSFTFDGHLVSSSPNVYAPDYRYFELVIFEYGGLRQPMIKGLDYTWDYTTGIFTLIISGDTFKSLQYYTVQFQPYTKTNVIPSMIIDFSYFIREITIPNIDPTLNARNAPILERLNYFIGKYEPECLEGILGYGLYKVILNESSSRVNDIIYGAEYTDIRGELRRWKGLVYDTKNSLIADYVYFMFQSASATQTTGVSTSVSKTEAGTSVSPGDKMMDAWSIFSTESIELVSFLWNQNQSITPVYPEIDDCQVRRSLNFCRPINIFGI